jgi:hypothetical protein
MLGVIGFGLFFIGAFILLIALYVFCPPFERFFEKLKRGEL